MCGQLWYLAPLTPVLKRLRQTDCEFEASPGPISKQRRKALNLCECVSCINQKKKKKKPSKQKAPAITQQGKK